MIKTFLEFFKVYWGYFMVFVTAVTFIWTLGVKSERKDNEKISIKKDVQEIKSTQSIQTLKIDSLFNIVNSIKTSQKDILINQRDVIKNQNAMRDSYVMFLTNQKGLTLHDFIQYMNGLQFQVVSPEDNLKVTPNIDTINNVKKSNYNIKVVPISPKK